MLEGAFNIALGVWAVAITGLVLWNDYDLLKFRVSFLKHIVEVQQVWCPVCGDKHEPPLCEE